MKKLLVLMLATAVISITGMSSTSHAYKVWQCKEIKTPVKDLILYSRGDIRESTNIDLNITTFVTFDAKSKPPVVAVTIRQPNNGPFFALGARSISAGYKYTFQYEPGPKHNPNHTYTCIIDATNNQWTYQSSYWLCFQVEVGSNPTSGGGTIGTRGPTTDKLIPTIQRRVN